jgi:hypothetical protein
MDVVSVAQAVCNLAMQFGEGEDAESGTMVSRRRPLPRTYTLTLLVCVPRADLLVWPCSLVGSTPKALSRSLCSTIVTHPAPTSATMPRQ